MLVKTKTKIHPQISDFCRPASVRDRQTIYLQPLTTPEREQIVPLRYAAPRLGSAEVFATGTGGVHILFVHRHHSRVAGEQSPLQKKNTPPLHTGVFFFSHPSLRKTAANSQIFRIKNARARSRGRGGARQRETYKRCVFLGCSHSRTTPWSVQQRTEEASAWRHRGEGRGCGGEDIQAQLARTVSGKSPLRISGRAG